MNSLTNNTNINTKPQSETSQFENTNLLGVTLSQRPTTSVASRTKAPSEFKDGDQVIREQPWTLDKMLARPNFISSVLWPAAATSHTVLAKLRVPQDLVDVNALTSAPFNSFIYWNGSVKLIFQVAGAPNVSGCLMATYVPLTNERYIDSNLVNNFAALSINPTNYLFANANTNAEMTIPYNSPYSYLNIEDITTVFQENTLGYVYLTVLNPIQLSTGSSDTVSVSVFSMFSNNKFKMPRISGVTRYMRAKAQSSENKPAGPGPLQSIAKIANSVMPSNIVGTVIDAGLGLLGLDKPIDPKTSEPNKVLSTQPMNFNTGIERIDKLTLQGSDIAPIDQDTFATTEDEMSFDYLFKKLSYLGSFNVNISDAIGKVVASYPMNPIPTRIQNETKIKLPLLSYISIPYEFWRGSLNYQLQVVATSLQTCKLYISFNYGQFTPDTSGLLDINTSQYGIAFEINQGSNELNFTVDYISNTHALHVPSSNIPSRYDTMGMINISVLNPLVSSNGAPSSITCNLFIAGGDDFHLDTLTASKNLYPYTEVQLATPNAFRKIRYIEEKECESDIEVIDVDKYRRKPVVKINRVAAQSSESAQPLITPVVDTDEAQQDVVTPKQVSVHRRMPQAQCYVPGVKDILNKYQMMERYRLRDPTSVQAADVHVIRLSDYFGYVGLNPTISYDPSSPYQPNRGNFTHYQMLYRLFKGGLNFKIMPVSVDIAYTMSVFYQPPVWNTASFGPDNWLKTFRNQLFRAQNDPLAYNSRSDPYQLRNCTRLPIHYVNGVSKTAEFSIPFSSRLNSILSKTGANAENELEVSEVTDLGSLVIYYNIPETTVFDGLIEFDVFMSLSDEARFGTIFNIPQVAVNSYRDALGVVITSPYPDDYGVGAPVANTLTIL